MEANKLQVFSSSAETIANIEDLLTDILLRVPSKKTLTRFKCVSKHWLSLISSPSFCISHTTRYKSLYICTSYDHLEEEDEGRSSSHGYRVHAIKLSDLFSLISNATYKPITFYPFDSESKSELDGHVLRQVTHMCSDNDSELPFRMGCGVLGSRIVLAGGYFKAADGFYYEPKPSYVLDTTEPEPMFDSSVIPALTGDMMYRPDLLQINGKLYALSDEIFAVYDPNFPTKGWTPLLKIPLWSNFFLCSVVESKIIASFPGGRTAGPRIFCYDVAASDRPWTPIAPLLGYEGNPKVVEPLWYIPGKALVVDSEDDYFDKLMFVVHYENILVFGIHLSEDGVPTAYELVATINLAEFPGFGFSSTKVKSSSGAYVGDGKVCFAFLFMSKSALRVPLLIFTFDFNFSSSPHDISNSSTSDPSIHCTSNFGSFSVKAPGYHLFEFNYAEESLPVPDTLLCDCIVL